MAQARQLLAREKLMDADLATASELIDQTLSLNATLEAAVKLRQEVLALRKRRERQREVDRHVRAALIRAHASFEEEDFEAAIEHCDDALAVFGESAEALELRSKAVAANDEVRRQRELKRRALQVVKEAREEFAAGQQERALARLEQFSPPHDLIARALEELRKDLESSTQARAQKEREAEAENRAAEKKFESSAEFRPLRERLVSLRGEAQHDELARNAELEAAAEEQRQAEARELERKAAAEALVAAEAEAKAREKEDKQRERRRQEQLAREKQDRERQQALAATYAATPLQPIEQPKQFLGEDAAAPPPQRLRVIYVAGTPGRWMASSVGVMVLLLTVGTWWAMKPNSTPNPPTSQQQVGRPPASNIPPGPSQGVNSGESGTPTVPDNPGQPAEPSEVNQPPPAVEQLPRITATQPPTVAGRGSEPLAMRAADPAQLRTLEAFRSTASQQLKAGQLVQALDAAAAGLKIDPRDPTLNAVMRTLLNEAQEAAARSKQDATDLDAAARAEEAFNQGLQREKQAVSLRRTGKIDAATRSFLVAADRFKAAAEESRRIEAEEQARIKTNPAVPPPPARLDQPKKPLNTDLEQTLVTQTLRRYEAAYASLSANDVRSVYPSAPIDQLAKDFADYRAYTLKIEISEVYFIVTETLTAVRITGRVTHDVLAKSGQRTQSQRSQIFTLEKQGPTWVIVHIR